MLVPEAETPLTLVGIRMGRVEAKWSAQRQVANPNFLLHIWALVTRTSHLAVRPAAAVFSRVDRV
jgi:hypothetical protein